MNDPARQLAKRRLAALVSRILADGIVDDDEREELHRFFREAVLTVTDVEDVFREHLAEVTDDVLADGFVTEAERRRCRAIVEELRVPVSMLSPELLAIVLSRSGPPS